MEKYQDSVKLKLSKAGSFVLDLDELWSKLKSTFSPDGYHEHKRDIEEHGARIASKFVTLSHHDDYTEKRLWDAAARMSEVHKPCAAIYPEFDSTKRISRLLIGFNENISAKERSALVNIWSKIKDASIDSTTSNKLLLLSDVINLQEYKVVYNSAKLASLLRDIAVDQDLKIEPLLTKLMDYQAKIETYSKEHTKDFRDNSDLVFWNDINEIEDLIDEALEMDQELIKEIPEWVLKHDTKEQSISFIKLYFLLHKIMVDNIELVKLNSNINTEFELLSKGFSRVITDVEKLTSAFHETESLHNVGSIDKIIDVVEHTGVKTLHAELAIIQHRMCELNPDGDEYIESVELLQGYVGVSKLSCEECYAVFTLLGLSKYVAGGHGVLFYNLWHLPQWELEEQVDSMVVYIKQHLEKRVDASVIPITDGVEFSELCHDFSDDEEDAPKSGHLTQEKYRDGFNWFKKCLSKMHHIGYSHDTSGFGIDRMMDSAVSYSPVECPIKSNDETHHNTPSIGTPIELYCNAKHHLEKRTSDCSSDTCIPSSIDGDQVSHHKSVQRHDSALRCIDKDNDNTPPLDLVACETTWSHDSI